MGGGWQLASACDFILASERSRCDHSGEDRSHLPARRHRATAAPGGTRGGQVHPLQRRGLRCCPSESARTHLETVPDHTFEGRAEALVQALRDRSQFSIHTLKHLIDSSDESEQTVEALWRAAWKAMTEGPDMDIGIRAFLHREQPTFAWQPRSLA